MKNIENLVRAAREENMPQFGKELQYFSRAMYYFPETSYPQSLEEKAWMFICGCLSERPEDLRCVSNALWKHHVSENKANKKEGWKILQYNLVCILLTATKTTVVDIIDDFKQEVQPTSDFHTSQKFVIDCALSNWISNQDWANDDLLLNTLINNNSIDRDSLVYKSIIHNNHGLLQALMRNADSHTREQYAIYVAGKWPQQIVEKHTQDEISNGFAQFHPLFAAIQHDFNMDALIACGLVPRQKQNKDTLDFCGGVYWAIHQASTWNGVSEPPKVYPSQFAQFNVLLEHVDLPPSTQHMDILQKMHQLCPDKLPRLQEWFNVMEKARLFSHVKKPGSSVRKKM